ncbi:MAG TPA: gephyrin-like molybdotransferase Glp [Terracidiphilus sp.]|jgi:molybdopterin molybdotransferase
MSSALPGYDEAAALVAAHAAELRCRKPVERVDLAHASGRVLATPLRADRDQPSFARSTRDGYACRAAEASSHMLLAIAGATRAGEAPAGPLPPKSAWEIMTGAPVPSGADAVMMLEHVDAADGGVRLLPPRTVAAGENIVPQGAQARAGEELVPTGSAIGFAQIALAASCGYAGLKVFAQPHVAILATGDELLPVESEPGPGQIRNSNGPMLAALVTAAGGEPWVLPTAADSAEALDAALAQAAESDMLLITGGVSAGKFDLVEPALARRGARFHFTGVRMQPGKPLVFGEMPVLTRTDLNQNQSRTHCCFFGLPGNPVSSAVTFLLFAAPVLAALGGRIDQGPRFALARLAADVNGKPGLTRFLPALWTFGTTGGGLPEVVPVEWQGSGDLAAMARCNCFLVVPENADRLEAGATIRILLL